MYPPTVPCLAFINPRDSVHIPQGNSHTKTLGQEKCEHRSFARNTTPVLKRVQPRVWETVWDTEETHAIILHQTSEYLQV